MLIEKGKGEGRDIEKREEGIDGRREGAREERKNEQITSRPFD